MTESLRVFIPAERHACVLSVCPVPAGSGSGGASPTLQDFVFSFVSFVLFVVSGRLIQESAWATELPILHVSGPGIGTNVQHFKNKNGARVRFFLFLCGAGLRAFGRGRKTIFFDTNVSNRP